MNFIAWFSHLHAYSALHGYLAPKSTFLFLFRVLQCDTLSQIIGIFSQLVSRLPFRHKIFDSNATFIFTFKIPFSFILSMNFTPLVPLNWRNSKLMTLIACFLSFWISYSRACKPCLILRKFIFCCILYASVSCMQDTENLWKILFNIT